jgi:multidrug efflux system membrane fusion protein
LQQAREQADAAVRAIDTEAGAEATVRARQAALAIAQRALQDTTVRATHAGRVVGLSISTGEIVQPSQSIFTLVNTEEWFAVANFREFDLSAIAIGDCATVYSMIDRSLPMKGIVQGIGFGVLDTDRINVPRSVPYVERSLNWVRTAQRFPVRVRLENPPPDLTRLGASAVVEVKHGAECR